MTVIQQTSNTRQTGPGHVAPVKSTMTTTWWPDSNHSGPQEEKTYVSERKHRKKSDRKWDALQVAALAKACLQRPGESMDSDFMVLFGMHYDRQILLKYGPPPAIVSAQATGRKSPAEVIDKRAATVLIPVTPAPHPAQADEVIGSAVAPSLLGTVGSPVQDSPSSPVLEDATPVVLKVDTSALDKAEEEAAARLQCEHIDRSHCGVGQRPCGSTC